jgi:dolichol-phosphate mannosyltransferase
VIAAQSTPEVAIDLSVVIPALNEAQNLALLLPELRIVLDELAVCYEILIVTRDANAETQEVAENNGAHVIEQKSPGYGGALTTAFEAAAGAYVITMDADLSHRPNFLRDLWDERKSADVIIASRYVTGGSADMPRSRYILSRVLNGFFRFGLNLPVRDLSSGFRLYSIQTARAAQPDACDFDVLPEILVRAYIRGLRIREVPFAYSPRVHGASHARVLKFGIAYLRTFLTLRRLRNNGRPGA